jgi:2-dehydropantoate 2-reductase
MRFGIVGTGALGGFYGGLLARQGHEVHFLMRSDVDHVRTHGLRVDSRLGDFHLFPVHAYSSADEMPECETIIVALKSTQNSELVRILPPLVGPNSLVLVLQNGLHVEQYASDVVGTERVAGGGCFLCSNKVGPGHIRHLDYGRILMGPYRGKRDDESGPSLERLNELRDLFRATGVECNTTENLSEARWRKLMWNITFNGLSVVLDSNTDAIVRNPESRRLAESLVEEVCRTANSCGVSIESDFIDKTMEHTDNMVPYDSSMRLDYLGGRPLELEAIYGNALEAAKSHGVHAPRVEMLYRQLQFLSAAKRSSAQS